MGVEVCGCVWEDTLGIAPCPGHRPWFERVSRLAVRMACRRDIPCREAYRIVMERVIASFIGSTIEAVHKKVG